MKNYSLLVLSNYRTYLKKMFPQSFTYILNGELFIKIAFFDLKKVITFLNLHTQSQYKILSDICATDFP